MSPIWAFFIYDVLMFVLDLMLISCLSPLEPGSAAVYDLDSVLRSAERLCSGVRLALVPAGPCRLWPRRSSSSVIHHLFWM